MRWPEATCESHVTMSIESDAHDYRVRIELTAGQDGQELGRRSWDETIPRDHQ